MCKRELTKEQIKRLEKNLKYAHTIKHEDEIVQDVLSESDLDD